MRILISAQDSASSIIKNLSNSFSSGSGLVGMVLGAGAALIGFGVASTKMAADYEQAMNMVQALTGSSTSQMAQYDSSIKSLAIDAGVAPTALASGLYNVVSAGYAGSAAIKVLTLATEDSKIGMTDSATTAKALTSIMAQFKLGVNDATLANGIMLETTTLGNATFEQYATSITKAASTSAQYGVSLQTMSAAWATLTSSQISAGMATTDYDQSLKVMYASIGTVTKSLHANGIAFDGNAFNAMDYGHKVVYLNSALQEARDKHIAITGATVQAVQAIKTISDHIGVYNQDLATLSNKQEMAKKTQEAWGTTQAGFNQQMSRVSAAVQVLMINIGSQLLPILTGLLSSVAPIIEKFADWAESGHAVSDMLAFLHNNAQIVVPILAGLAAMIIAVLVPAVWSLASGVIAATWPVLAIGAAVAGLVAIFVHFYQTNSGFKAFVDGLVAGFQHIITVIQANFVPVWNAIKKAFDNVFNAAKPVSSEFDRMQPILQGIGIFLQSTFKPVWDQLASTFQGELVPAWKSLVQAIQPLMPQLKMFAQFLGGAVLLAITIVISTIGGLIGMFAGLLKGVIQVFAGIVSVITGSIKIITGIIAVFIDIATGNFGNLSKDLGTIMDGIGTMFHGIWETIKGIWNTAMGTIEGFSQGFGSTISGIFQNLSNLLVGHSIIPDMINSIVNWFQGLPGKAGSAVSGILGSVGSVMNNLYNQAIAKAQSLVTGIGSALNNAAGVASAALSSVPGAVAGMLASAVSSAVSGGNSIVQGIANGINGAIGAVTGAIGNVVSTIDSYLPHSPAKKGPLTQLNKYGKALVETFSNDIKSHSPKAQAAAESMIGNVAKALQAFPKQIAYADLHGNKAEVAKLKAERLQDELLMKKYRDIITLAGYQYQTGNLNDLINFTKKTTSTPTKTTAGSGVTGTDLSWLQAQLRQIITILGAGLGIDTRSNGGGSSIPFYLENPSYSASGRGGLSPGAGRGVGGGSVINIYINTMARSQSEVNNMVDMIEQTLSQRFRSQTPSYSTGGIF